MKKGSKSITLLKTDELLKKERKYYRKLSRVRFGNTHDLISISWNKLQKNFCCVESLKFKKGISQQDIALSAHFFLFLLIVGSVVDALYFLRNGKQKIKIKIKIKIKNIYCAKGWWWFRANCFCLPIQCLMQKMTQKTTYRYITLSSRVEREKEWQNVIFIYTTLRENR